MKLIWFGSKLREKNFEISIEKEKRLRGYFEKGQKEKNDRKTVRMTFAMMVMDTAMMPMFAENAVF